jgi:hypothetical protein
MLFERRNHERVDLESKIEYVLNHTGEVFLEENIVNISEFGLCLDISSELTEIIREFRIFIMIKAMIEIFERGTTFQRGPKSNTPSSSQRFLKLHDNAIFAKVDSVGIHSFRPNESKENIE